MVIEVEPLIEDIKIHVTTDPLRINEQYFSMFKAEQGKDLREQLRRR